MSNISRPYALDQSVPQFDDSAPILIFDGCCVLCSAGVKWLLRRDPKGASKFLAVQSPLARAIYAHFGRDPDDFDTFMLLKDGVSHVKWRGLLEAAKTMPAPWKWLGFLGQVVPHPLGDVIYGLIQRNRFNWFGRRETCLAPTPEIAARFIVS